MIQFQYPELFLLAIPLWFAFRRWGWTSGVTGRLRLAMLVALLLAITGPKLNLGGRGIDVVVLADRSRSLPSAAGANIRELIKNLENNRGTGDRVGVVTFASTAQIELGLSATAVLDEYTKQVLPDGSDLNDAINVALNQVIDKRRPARILVLSDGEANGRSPLSGARRAREDGVPVDYRLFERSRAGDVAVESVHLPEAVSPREPFQFAVDIFADGDRRGTVRVLRDGELIATQDSNLLSGTNRLLFRDLLDGGGLYSYSVELDVLGDPLAENNRGAGVVRVDAGSRVLVLTAEGDEGNFVQALRAARIPVDVAIAQDHPLTPDSLERYRAVVIENVPADQLGRVRMEHLAQFVEDLGGGLMLTGGKRSFGTGGYFKSPLDEVLPVSMEMREEHRKGRVALAVALDRSGSMTAPVKGGKQKMDLANLGTAECVKLLSPTDKVAVIAVDSTPHVIQELTSVDAPGAIINRVLGIESLGGGIFVYEALVAAGQELMKADDYQTRHIILFSDAADSEEPGDFKNLLKQYESNGITVSVIGLGTQADPDAKLLEEIAKLGGGNIMFTADAEELPRLFTQDTMSIARSTFITKDDTQTAGIPGKLLPSSRLMGEFGGGSFPNVDGYNLSYLKPEATAAVMSQDEYAAPWSAFWFRGLGRVAALTLEVDGKHSGSFGSWENYEDFLVTHTRWILGGDDAEQVFVDLNRDGQDAVVTVELDPKRPGLRRAEPPQLIVVPPGAERQEPVSPDLIWTGANTLTARFRMDRTGTYRTILKTSEKSFTRGPAVTLPYSPEFAPRVGLPSGQETLQQVAEISGGQARTDVVEAFADPPRSPQMMSLLPWLLVLAVILLLFEIAGRRLMLWERLSDSLVPEVDAGRPAGWLPKWKLSLPRRKRRTASSPKESAAGAPAATSEPADSKSPTSVYDQAKARAKRRLTD